MGPRNRKKMDNPRLPLELIDLILEVLVKPQLLDSFTISQIFKNRSLNGETTSMGDSPVPTVLQKPIGRVIKESHKRAKQNWISWANCRLVNRDFKRMVDSYVSFEHPVLSSILNHHPLHYGVALNFVALDSKELPLIKAILKNRTESLKTILKCRTLSKSYCTFALQFCLSKREMLKILLEDGRTIHNSGESFNQLKMILEDHIDGGGILKLLLSHMEFKQDEWEASLMLAMRCNNLGAVQTLLEDERIDPAANNNRALITAVENGKINVVKMLLKDNRVDPSIRQNKALRCAALRGHEEVLKVLLEDSRVDPSAESNEAIYVAASYGHEKVVRLLMADNRVDPFASNNRAKESAIAKGHVKISKLIGHPPGTNEESGTQQYCQIM